MFGKTFDDPTDARVAGFDVVDLPVTTFEPSADAGFWECAGEFVVRDEQVHQGRGRAGNGGHDVSQSFDLAAAEAAIEVFAAHPVAVIRGRELFGVDFDEQNAICNGAEFSGCLE